MLGSAFVVVLVLARWVDLPLWVAAPPFITLGVLLVTSGLRVYLNNRPRATTDSVALDVWVQECWEQGVLPFVRRIVNKHLEPMGAIGLAGPRGVGRTSLIEHFADRSRTDAGLYEYWPLTVKVSAPVQYEPRD